MVCVRIIQTGLCVLFTLISFRSAAQFKYNTSNQYIVTINHFGTKHGLVHRAVTAVYNDNRGVIWVATRFGISRFDGYTYRNFNLPETWETPITTISEDKDGFLWVTNSYGQNVLRFHTLYLKWSQPTESKMPVAIRQHKGDLDFVKSGNGELLFFLSGKKEVYCYNGKNNWSIIPLARPIVRSYIKFGPCFMDTDKQIFVVENKKLSKNRMLEKWLGGGRQYIKTPFGVMYNFSKTDSFSYENALGQREIVSDKNRKYIYGGRCLFDFTLEIEKLGVPDLRNEDFENIKKSVDIYVPELRNNSFGNYIHHDGSIIVANNFGLFVINVRKALFTSFAKSFGNPVNHSKLFATRGMVKVGNQLLVNQEETGLYSIDLQTGILKKVYPDKADLANGFNLSRITGNRLLAFIGDHYLLFDTSLNLLKTIEAGNSGGFCALEVSPDLILLGPHYKGRTIHWLNLQTDSLIPFNTGKFKNLDNCVVNQIARNRSGRVVICSRNGIFFCDEQYRIAEEWNSKGQVLINIPSQTINCFYQDEDNTYWLGSGDKGLFHVYPQTGKVVVYNTDNGFPNNTINIISADQKGNLWISTDDGLVCFNKKAGYSFHFTESDGLSYNEFNRGSFCLDERGSMYFGSLNGVTRLNPDRINLDNLSNFKRLRVLGFSKLVNNEKDARDFTEVYFKTRKLTIYPNDKSCILDVSLLDYTDPQQVIYAYRIKDIEDYWTYRKQPGIRLGKIPYGEHELLVKAMLPGYGWTKVESITVKVVRPFYLTFWFLSLLVALLITGVFFYIKWRTARLLRERMQLETEVLNKTQTIQKQSDALKTSLEQKEVLLKEIHHRVKNNLQVINSLLEMQNLRLENADAKAALKDGQIRIMSIALIHQQMFQNENLSELSLQEFITNLYSQVYLIYNEEKKHIKFSIIGDDRFIDMETAVPLGLILNEIFTNSFKYAMREAEGNYIDIRLMAMDRQFVITYHDSGEGMPPGFDFRKSKSLGLRLIHSLAKQINAHITYNNQNGENLFRIEINQSLHS